jgi:hypothetical protein
MRNNLAELPALVHLAGHWGAEQVFVQRLCHDFDEESLPDQYREMHAYIEDQTLDRADPSWISAVFEEARHAASEAGLELRLPRSGPPQSRARCDWPWRGAYISYQGLSMPCCMISTPDRLNFGSVARDGIQAVWDGEAYEAFRRALDSDEPPDICRSCAVYRGTF